MAGQPRRYPGINTSHVTPSVGTSFGHPNQLYTTSGGEPPIGQMNKMSVGPPGNTPGQYPYMNQAPPTANYTSGAPPTVTGYPSQNGPITRPPLNRPMGPPPLSVGGVGPMPPSSIPGSTGGSSFTRNMSGPLSSEVTHGQHLSRSMSGPVPLDGMGGVNLGPTTNRPMEPPPVSMGPPPARSMGPPPTGSMGPHTGSMGPPPARSMGPPTGLMGPPAGMGPPPTGSMGPPPTSMGPTPTSMGPPPAGPVGPPTGSMGPPTGSMGPPPTGSMGPPPTGSMGPTPTGSMGPPPTGSMGPPPTGSMGPPPTGSMGPPPTGSMGPTPTSSIGQPAPLGQRYPRGDMGPPSSGSGNIVSDLASRPGPYQQPPGLAGPSDMHKQQLLPELQPINLLESRTSILPSDPIKHPLPNLPGHMSNFLPDPGVFCSSINTVPATSGLLNKLKLPMAIHIHPFKDSKAKTCPVINPSVIVRCRVCRAYINPYVAFSDARHWRCNMCFRTNVVPEDYDYNPHSGKRGDRTHHAELRHSSVEYIAPSEYMVRPPQPSVYLFLIDVSYNTIESGLLGVFCRTLLDCLNRLPGDGRTMVGFLTYDQHLHFYNLKSSQTQPQMLVVTDINDPFIPSPNSLLVNLRESKELVKNLLEELPKMFVDQRSGDSALGSALQVAEKLLHPIGGRITVLQSTLPNVGPGALKIQEQPSALKKDQLKMQASTDFYKKLAIECSGQQIAVDVFVFSSPKRFIDLATFSTIAKFSSGQISYYPEFHHSNETSTLLVSKDLRRYLTRNIGFEAVMRVRCTEGLSLHTFHGNFFVRSTDLLSLPNVNPDHGYCMNLAIDESLKEYSTVCFQAALLYTTYRGERRIRVHTLCLPVSDNLSQIYSSINVRATAAVLAKMAVDRMGTASLGDARDAILNTIQDSTKAYRSNIGSSMPSSQFVLPSSLKLLPLYVLSLLKHPSLSLNPNIMIDERACAASLVLTLPLNYLLANIYPTLHALYSLNEKDVIDVEGDELVSPPILQLSAEYLNRQGVYLMDYGKGIYIWVSKDVSPETVRQLFGVPHFGAIPEFSNEIPSQDSSLSRLTQALIRQIKLSRQHYMPLYVVREDSSLRKRFINKLVQDKTDDGTSYYELLSHVARQINK